MSTETIAKEVQRLLNLEQALAFAKAGDHFLDATKLLDEALEACAACRVLGAEVERLSQAFAEQACPTCHRHRPYCNCLDTAIQEIKLARAELAEARTHYGVGPGRRYETDYKAARAAGVESTCHQLND